MQSHEAGNDVRRIQIASGKNPRTPCHRYRLGFGPSCENDAGCIKVQVYIIGEKQ